MPLPNFIIIGAMKSGTGSLYHHLKSHPQIGMSKIKETNYFSDEYNRKPLEWYKNMFSREALVNGEASPNYTKKHIFPGTAKRMKDLLPEVKLIYITRDPIDRIISHLHHNLYSNRLKEDIDEEVLKNDHYWKTSCYFYQVEEYLKYYDRRQLLFIILEELKQDFNGTLNRVCEFIGVDNFTFNEKNMNAHKSSEKYFVKNKNLMKTKLPSKAYGVYEKFYRKLNIKVKRPQLKEKTLSELNNILEDDIRKFRRFLNVEKINN